MNLGDLRQEVLEHEFSESRYSDYVDTQLNRCQLLIADRLDFRALVDVESISVVAADNSYALPTDYMRLDSLWDLTNTVPLQEISVGVFNDIPAGSGRPTKYTLDGEQVKISPTPDAALTLSLYYHRSPVELVDDADEPEIPERAQPLLVRYALARCFERENDTVQAQYHWSQYDKEMLYAMGSINDDADDVNQPRVVEGQWTQPDGITVVRP